jgi:hypothetical protein
MLESLQYDRQALLEQLEGVTAIFDRIGKNVEAGRNGERIIEHILILKPGRTRPAKPRPRLAR